MNSDRSTCPHCNRKIADFGVFSANPIFDSAKNALINEYCEQHYDFRCTTCGDEVIHKCVQFLNKERDEHTQLLQGLLQRIPVISVHNPSKWDYKVIDLVTAQSTLGTGLITDVASVFTDLFGKQSGSYNKKLQEGEELCKAFLRAKALRIGANAILAVDVDYTDFGGAKSMVCVCMTGTAIHLNNPEIFDTDLSSNAARLKFALERLDVLNKIYPGQT